MLKLTGLLVLMFGAFTNGFYMQPDFYGAPQDPYSGQNQPGQWSYQGQHQPGQWSYQGQHQPGQWSYQGQNQPGQWSNQGQHQPGQWSYPGQHQPGQASTNLQLNNCPVAQACQALSSNSNLAPFLQQTITSLASQITLTALFSPNQQITFPCTNYDPSPKPNSCRANIPLMTNFNVNAILGKWYFLAVYNFGPFLSDISCGTDEFTLNGNSLTLTTTFYTANETFPTNIPLDLNIFRSGEMKFTNNGNNADLKVVSTDYTSYVIWYNCGTSSTGQPFERVTVEVRSPTSVSASTLNAITTQLNRIGFSPCEVGFVGRSRCPSV